MGFLREGGTGLDSPSCNVVPGSAKIRHRENGFSVLQSGGGVSAARSVLTGLD